MEKSKMVLIFLMLSLISLSQIKFEDIPEEHWAYKSVENLVKKGIIAENTFEFKGDKSLTRYEFAYDLSKALNKINLEKANQKELDVLTKIIADFSEELNKTGFDRIAFEEKIKNIETNIEKLEGQLGISNRKLEDIEKRLKLIERELKLD